MWPQATSGSVALMRARLSMLLEGIDWRGAEVELATEGCVYE